MRLILFFFIAASVLFLSATVLFLSATMLFLSATRLFFFATMAKDKEFLQTDIDWLELLLARSGKPCVLPD